MSQPIMTIDSHVHVLPEKRLGGLMRWIRRAFPPHPVPENITEEQIVEDLRSRGVSHFFNLAYPLSKDETESLNDWNLEFCGRTPGAVPFASMHVETEDKARVGERALADGFLGFKFHPFVQRFDPWDERMFDLYEMLADRRRPVLFHTGFGDFYRMEMPADKLEALLERFPGLPAVFVHMAFPELEKVFAMMDRFPDLYLDATNVLSVLRPEFKPWLDFTPGSEAIPDLLCKGIERRADRIMYGSDHPAGMGGLDDIYNDLESLKVSDETKKRLAGDTARNLIERYIPGYVWPPSLQK